MRMETYEIWGDSSTEEVDPQTLREAAPATSSRDEGG